MSGHVYTREDLPDLKQEQPDLRQAGKQAELSNRFVEHWRSASTVRRHVYVWTAFLISLPVTGGLSLFIAPIWWYVYRRPAGYRLASDKKLTDARVELFRQQYQRELQGRWGDIPVRVVINHVDGSAAVPTRYVPEHIRRAVHTRDGGRCRRCRTTFDLQYDHVKAFSRGGAHTVANLQLLCGPCNRRKGAR